MSEIQPKPALVIDNGSGLIKAGLSGEQKPSLLFPSFIGRPKYYKVLPSSLQDQDYYIGPRAQQNRGLLKIRYAMTHGIVQNWTDMQNIWRYVYNQLEIEPYSHPVLLTQAPFNPPSNRQRAAQIFFQTFQSPSIFIALQALLSLYAYGVTTGIVLDCGDGVTHAVPVYQGYSLTHQITRINLAGRDVTNHLALLLKRAGHSFGTSAQFQLVKQIKEKNCYVATMSSNQDKVFDDPGKSASVFLLPDGRPINLGAQKYRAAEILFSPDKVGLEYPGVQDTLNTAIQKTDYDLRKLLYGSVFLAGGTTMMPGFGERLQNDLRRLSPKEIKIKIMIPNGRKLACWMGGCIATSLPSFSSMWITRQEYEEQGKRILHIKSF